MYELCFEAKGMLVFNTVQRAWMSRCLDSNQGRLSAEAMSYPSAMGGTMGTRFLPTKPKHPNHI